MCLATVPSEIVLLVVDHLVDVADVVSLQLACKRMNALISDAPQVLWKRQLENECSRNALFGPSFAQIHSGAALKKAATSGYRLSKAYERALANDSGIGMTSRTLTLPQHGDDPRETRGAIEEMWLIPGGRFLVVFREDSLEIFDISLRIPHAVMAMGLTGAVNSGFYRIVYQNVVDNETFHIIYETLQSESFDSDLLESDDVVTTYVFLEFTSPGSASFDINIKGQAVVMHHKDCTLGGISVSGDNVVFLFDELTVLWNAENDVHIGWFMDNDIVNTSSMDVILCDKTVVYITKDAVCGVRIPRVKPLEGNEIIWDRLDEKNLTLAPEFLFPYTHTSYPATDEGDDEDADEEPLHIITSASINLVNEKQGIFYEIREVVEVSPEQDNFEGDVLSYSLHHRYKFTFDTINPGASYLEHISSLPVAAHLNIDEEGTEVYEGLEPQPFQTAGRSSCSLWVDAAVGPAFLSNDNWAESTLETDRISLVPLALPAREAEWNVFLGSSMCAASGKVAAVWRGVNEENQDEVIDHLVVYELEQ